MTWIAFGAATLKKPCPFCGAADKPLRKFVLAVRRAA